MNQQLQDYLYSRNELLVTMGIALTKSELSALSEPDASAILERLLHDGPELFHNEVLQPFLKELSLKTVVSFSDYQEMACGCSLLT